LKPCDWKELLQLIERIRKRIAQELKKPVEVISCYEAGYDGFWLHRLLEAQGVRNHVIDPASLQVDRRARRAKTDGIDVGKLLRSLMAYLRGEPRFGASSVYQLSSKRTIVGFTANVAG
jgi:transposase